MAIKTLFKRIASVVFFIGIAIICLIISFRSCLVVDEQYISYDQKLLDETVKAKENLTVEELNTADEIWLEAEEILKSHMSEEEKEIWFDWMLIPPNTPEEINKYTDFYNKILKRLSKDEKKRFFEIENELKQFLKETSKQ